MVSNEPVFSDITNQPLALEAALAYHRGPGRAALRQAVEWLRQALETGKPVVVVAIGASYSACIPFVTRLAAAGERIWLEDAAEFLHYGMRAYLAPAPSPAASSAPLAKAGGALFLLVSRSGSTAEMVRSLQRLKQGGQRVIGVTNVAGSPLAAGADLTVLFGGPNDHRVAIQTYLTTLLVMDLLAEALVGSNTAGESLIQDGLVLIEAVRKGVEQFRERSENWRADMRSFQAAYLLGRGASLASVDEGVLLFHEMARFPAISCSAGNFRHGRIEVVDERLRCFVFAPRDGTYELNLALARRLAQLGARTTIVSGPHPSPLPAHSAAAFGESQSVGLELWELPDGRPEWAPYLEIIPLQWFTYQLARWQGLTPGEFRTASSVILDES